MPFHKKMQNKIPVRCTLRFYLLRPILPIQTSLQSHTYLLDYLKIAENAAALQVDYLYIIANKTAPTHCVEAVVFLIISTLFGLPILHYCSFLS